MPVTPALDDVGDARNDLIFRRLRFLLFYAAVVYPLFFFMDWKERPLDWRAALTIRLSVTAIMLLLVGLAHTDWGRPKALLLATAGFLVGHAGFAAIVWHARGFGSSNRDDFELFFGTYCVLVPTTTWKAAIVGGAMICIQLAEYALSGTPTHYDDVVWNAVPFFVIFLTARHVSNLIEIEWRKEFVWARDLEKVNEQLVATQNTLVQSEKLAALGQLTAEIAHELNNPLTGITVNLSPIEREVDAHPDTPESVRNVIRESLALVREGSEQAVSVIRRLSQFGSLISKDRSLIDVNEVLETSAALVAELSHRKGISISTEFAPLPKTWCDAQGLCQVFVNVLQNACQALDGPGDIRIQSAFTEGWIRISVRDSGPGIPDEILKRVFEPNISGKKGHSGLGLSISRRILEEHGGAIQAANTPAGAEIGITIPVSSS